MAAVVFCDFEFNKQGPVCACYLDGADDSRAEFDFRTPAGRDALHRYIADRPDRVWAAYSAQAEMTCLLELGVDIRPMAWIDLFAEARMLTGTHPGAFLHRAKLVDVLALFELTPEGMSEAKKKAMYALILSSRTFTEAEMAEIVAYCWTDVTPLPDLLHLLAGFHAEIDSPWERDHALYRGEYVKAAAILHHRTRGIPLDMPWFNAIFDNRPAVRHGVAEECNREYGMEIYRRKLGKTIAIDPRTRVRTQAIEYSFNHANLETWLQDQPFYEEWARTDKGKRRLDRDYLDDLSDDFPALKPMKHARDAISQLKDDKIRQLEKDGYIKPGSVCFHTVTGRNQPMVSDGFLFNSPPWFRSVIRPKPGWALIALDWSKQEPAIGVALSGDAALRAAYESHDLYLELAMLAGAVPRDADPQAPEVKLQRQAFKAASLGLSYGMGQATLAQKLFSDLNRAQPGSLSRREAHNLARRIIRWHRQTFATYWQFLYQRAEDAREIGWTSSFDGWLYFADADTKVTRLINFPMQSTGGHMLREAMKILAYETEVDIVCSLHDAVYAQCRIEEVEATTAIVRDAMTRAVRIVLGDVVDIKIGVEVYTYEKPYRDGRGAKMLDMIERMVGRNLASPRSLTQEVAPKPRKAA